MVTRHGAVHLGMATQTDAGLMVPVIRDAQDRNLWQLATEIRRLAEAARNGNASSAELSGSTITITSLEGFLLTPFLLKQSSELNPVATTVGLAFWTWLWGMWGVLLGIPILMLVKTVSDHVAELQPLGEWLGSE